MRNSAAPHCVREGGPYRVADCLAQKVRGQVPAPARQSSAWPDSPLPSGLNAVMWLRGPTGNWARQLSLEHFAAAELSV